jgi:hypothetical protein
MTRLSTFALLAAAAAVIAWTPARAEDRLGPCMWNAMPAAQRASISAAPDVAAVGEQLSAAIDSWGEADIVAASERCGANDAMGELIGRVFATYAYQLWAEARLAPIASTKDLDKAFTRLSEAERTALEAMLQAPADAAVTDEQTAALDKLLAAVPGVEEAHADDLTIYLTARLARWRDDKEFDRLKSAG